MKMDAGGVSHEKTTPDIFTSEVVVDSVFSADALLFFFQHDCEFFRFTSKRFERFRVRE